MKDIKTSTIYCGDNLEILRQFPNKCVDLIYADPPFFTNKHYEIIWNDGAERAAFEDRWQGGIYNFTQWIKERLMECHRVLSDKGSMYLHCDWHANAYLRIAMDEVFGEDSFTNEIVWNTASLNSAGFKTQADKWIRGHDTILYYRKSPKNYKFNKQYTLRDEKFITKHYRNKDAKGIYRITRRGNTVYKNDDKGNPISDVWNDILSFNYVKAAKESIGYPTQKPEALLKRIIEASSNNDDIVLDPFCGCGTTIAVAYQSGGQWVGIDVSPTACQKMAYRLNKLGVIANLQNMPETIEHLKDIDPYEFQNWVVRQITGKHANKKTGDMGIDGFDFTGKPIQVKQSPNIGRNVVDNFETAIRRAGYTEGTIYAFSFVKGAKEEVARASLKDNLNIKLIDIKNLLDGVTMQATEKQATMIKTEN